MHLSRILKPLCLSLLLGLTAACSSADEPDAPTSPAGASPGVVVQVPKIEGPVALEQFCATFRQLHCLANTSCCTAGEHHASNEECLQKAPCPEILRDAQASPLLASGEITYDASAAGDLLRAMADDVSRCSPPRADVVERKVLAGTRPQGADCSPSHEEDALAPLSCGAGLRCEPQADAAGAIKGVCSPGLTPAAPVRKALGDACEDGAECDSGRCAAAVCAARQKVGQACLSADDCESNRCQGEDGSGCLGGSCSCAEAGALYCSAPPPAPPSNDDWSSPTSLCVKANDSDNAGTSNTRVVLGWLYANRRYKCEISGGIKDGEEKCCTPVYTTYTLVDGTQFGVKNESSDGLRVTSVKAIKGSSTWSVGTVRDFDPDLECVGCFFGTDCESCWLDTDGHGDCRSITITMTGNNSSTCGFNWE